MEPEIKYIELKSGQGDCGPAWIARVQKSKSGRTIYFNGRALKSCGGRGIGGNYFDTATGSEYWVSGVKKRGWNRHWAGGGKIKIEKSLVKWLRGHVEYTDFGFLEIIDDFPDTDVAQLHTDENRPMYPPNDRGLYPTKEQHT